MPLLERTQFTGERRDQFIEYLTHQIQQTAGDREPLLTKWENSLIQWRAQLPDESVDFPFLGASNLEMPLTAIHSDPVYADLMQTLHAPEDYWTPRANRPDRVQHANAVREGLRAVEKRHLKMKRVNRTAMMYNVILGTAVYKNHWQSGRKAVKDYGPDGEVEEIIKRWSRPQIEHIPLQRFWFPANAWSLNPDEPGGSQWLAQEFFLTESQVRVMAQGSSTEPSFDADAVEEALRYFHDTTDRKVEREIQTDDNYTPFEDRKLRLMEVWARFDVDGDGIDEDVVAIFQPESRILLRSLHNPFLHGQWPFHVTNYLPGFGILGIGMSETDEWAQEALTKMLNAQLDNVMLANTRMYAAPLGSNIQPGESVYPGKIWFTGPGEEVSEVRMSDIYQSLPQAIGQFMQFAEMRTGVSEIRQGNLTGLPSRTPATSLLSILREGNKRFDMILNGIRDVHSEMGLRTLQNLAQHFREEPEQWTRFFGQALGEQDAGLFLEVLQGSVHDIEESFGISVTATSAQVNKEVEKQSFIGLMQVVNQIYQSLIQSAMLSSQAPDPLTKETAMQSYRAGTELLKRLLERFDVQNPSEYVPNLQALQGAMQGMQGGNPMAGVQGSPVPTGQAGVSPSQFGNLFGL